jgi:OmcA/MtrC family decaheme c-type cytochrome
MKYLGTVAVATTLFTAAIVIPMQVSRTGGLFESSSHRRAAAPSSPEHPTFAPDQLEAYLTDSGIAFIRPGLKIHVNTITIGTDRKPVVDLNLTDSLDQPLDRLGKVTPGPIALSFVLSWYDPATQNYTSYITRTETASADSPHPGAKAVQAAADSGGAFTDLESGHATYKFGNALPSGFDGTRTHTLGIYSTRTLIDILGKNYFANVEFDFRPDGNAVTAKWDEIRQASSCNNCHDPLSAHGGARQDVKLCVLCHNPQTSDAQTGNSVDFKVLIHKIHSGSSLPSVKAGTPYQIYGFGNAIVDFSTVVYPQDILNCTNCHEGTDPASKPSQSASWETLPTRATCGSCHDDVDFATGAKHPGGPQPDDKSCSTCHTPDSGHEFDASIKGAHTVPGKSKQLKGIVATIVSITNLAAGKKPTVVFDIHNSDGTAIDGTKLTAFAPMYAGPTSNYKTFIRESALASGKTPGTFNSATGTTSYTFSTALPPDAGGTWSATADIERAFSLVRADGNPNLTGIESTVNPVKYASSDGSAVVPRRVAVTLAQCNVCHDSLALHGGQRMNTLECVMCHNPTTGDESRRPASAGQPESISFQRLIHRIHTGDDLTQDFTIFGFGGTVNNFNEVRFPGDRRNCAKCHTGTSFTLPLQPGLASVITLRDFFTPHGPATAACLGCHDSRDVAAHAFLNTTSFGGTGTPAEACATCHGAGAEFDVVKMHAR